MGIKFRDRKTGEVFDVEREGATGGFCAHIGCCTNCPLPECAKECDCSDWIIAHPAEAARLMGFEVVVEKEEPTEQTDMPRICKVLGVEVGEPFDFGSGTYIILEALGGKFLLYYFGQNSVPGSEVLSEMIAHPDRIIRKPRFTEEEVADARAVQRFYPDAVAVHRTQAGNVLLADAGNVFAGKLPNELFPSLRLGTSISVKEVIGETK